MKRKQQDTYELTQTIQYGRCTIQIMRPVFKTPEERAARERQVAELLHQGHTAKEIGKQLALSPATVVTYKSRVFEKSGVKSLKEFLTRSAGWFH